MKYSISYIGVYFLHGSILSSHHMLCYFLVSSNLVFWFLGVMCCCCIREATPIPCVKP